MPAPLSFRAAVPAEAARIAALINSAYRGDSSRAGWTTEADLLEGIRTDEAEIVELIGSPGSIFLVGVADGEIVATVHLERKDGDAAHLGLFVVKPDLQSQGFGKQLMEAAERGVVSEWGTRRMTMTVISRRVELVAFYERRGYRRTGVLRPFPKPFVKSVPKVSGLEFEDLEKKLF